MEFPLRQMLRKAEVVMRNRIAWIVLFLLLCMAPVGLFLGAQLWPTAHARQASSKPQPDRKTYELRGTGGVDLIRFKPRTGEAWIKGIWIDQWVKIKEPRRLPAGNYDIITNIITIAENHGGGAAYRIDQATGTTWQLDPGKDITKKPKWVEIKEPKE
jgi:hypothetical protein